ncbi:MAG: efflux RND transporter permease subunit, partial [Terracidiphilus sp.]
VIPSISVPLSITGTFGVMYLLHYTIDNFSLMALAICTGFVVDDAIVVIENITRYHEAGLPAYEAALRGSREIGFTVLSMSLSLIAVFTPILLMGGIVGRLFREFAVTLSIAIAISLCVSLSATPMLCAKFLKPVKKEGHNWAYKVGERGFDGLRSIYDRGLRWVLDHQLLTLGITVATVVLNVALYIYVPKGLFPQQDTGGIGGNIQASQDISFAAMAAKQQRYASIVSHDPAVDSVITFAGGSGGTTNTGRMFITLKPLSERNVTAEKVINRLRKKLNVVPGATLYLQANQDIRVGGHSSNAQYQYTLESEDLSALNTWAPRLLAKMKTLPMLRDVSSDQQTHGLQARLVIDRDTASRLGLNAATIDNTLYDAFGQRQVSTVFTQLNEYHLVMEVDPKFQENPDSLRSIYVRSSTGMEVPLSAFTHYESKTTSLAVNH